MLCWFNLQNMVHTLVNLMKIISPVGDDHNEGTKGEEFHIEKQKEDKENDINMVGQSSEHFCSVCLEFKRKYDMLRLRDKCNHPFSIENISNHVTAQIQQLKDDYVQFRLELQRFSDMMQNLMNRPSVVDQDHGEQKKTEEFHVQKQKEEDKENNIKDVDQPSESFCGICLDFKAESDMFRAGKCKDLFCIDYISKHVASKIQQNNLEVKCPIPSCSVEIKPEYLLSILPKDVIDRWEFAKYESSITLSQKVYCPFKNCSVLLLNDGKKGKLVTRCQCPYCRGLFCAQCVDATSVIGVGQNGSPDIHANGHQST
ncbi:unnamed protein product [Lupinus luteus]|uniref:RING-type domain-containing protein n=1 Tax=Lupinus luteus TaxID=3873 RepID=A0AAV1VXE8_LUPLU